MMRSGDIKHQEDQSISLAGSGSNVLAILFVQIMTDSGFKDLGGPIDLILLIAIGCGCALVAPMFTYLLLGLRDSRR